MLYAVRFTPFGSRRSSLMSRVDVVSNLPRGTSRGWRALGFTSWERADEIAGNLRKRGMRASAVVVTPDRVDPYRIISALPMGG